MSNDCNKVTRCPLRYLGGKWLLAPWIISHFPPHRLYCEPFGGGGSVLIRKDRVACEVYNDIDGEIVHFFKVLRDHGPDLIAKLSLTPYSRSEHRASYLPDSDPIERARKTAVRSFFGHGSAGIFRRTGFKIDRGTAGSSSAQQWANYADAMYGIIERFRCVTIEEKPAVDVMRIYDTPDTLHYVDPPYVKSTRTAKKAYRFEMTDPDHSALLEAVHTMKGSVIVSGYRSDLYDAALMNFKRIDRPAKANGRSDRIESLWLKP
jgi:DNA adenine methylase